MIPYGRQSLDEDDIAAVTEVLQGNWLTQGPSVEAFEDALARRSGAAHAVVFTNGTAALHAATAIGGLGPGDVVATSPLTFIASANCARYVGASVMLVDIDPDTLNMDIGSVPPCQGLVAVHFAGLPVNLAALHHRPRVIIEDAAHALGATTPDGPVGNCARSDMCVFSFHPVKAITSGEGGAVTTNSRTLAEGLRRFRSHFVVHDQSQSPGRYHVPELGFNYRMSDIHAALGLSQLGKLDRFIERRGQLAERYRAALSDLPLRLPPSSPPGWRHAYHLFAIRVEHRDEVYTTLRQAEIGVQIHYPLIHQFDTFRSLANVLLPNAERVGAEILSIPLFPALKDEEQDQVIFALGRVLEDVG